MRVQLAPNHHATWNGSLTINYYADDHNYDCITIGGVYTTDNPPSQLEALQTLLQHLADRDTVSQFQHCFQHCPACGDPIDYCQGHGMIADPWGNDVLWDHDHGIHDRCHANADCEV